MPVGTAGSVKAVSQQQLLNDVKAEIILGNTYHLYLRPGLEILEEAGGLHKFNGWNKPILTDSGGYQVFSLADTRKIKEEGVTFQSHIDGSKHLFTPEIVMDIQRSIGGDIIMAFDECPPGGSDFHMPKHPWILRIAGWIVVLTSSILRNRNTDIHKIYFQLYREERLRNFASNPANTCVERCNGQCNWRIECGRTRTGDV